MHIFKFLSIIIGGVGVDLLTKYLFFDLRYGSILFTPTLNNGISFGIGVPLFVTIGLSSIFVVGVLIGLFQQKIPLLIGGLIVAGAIGNLVDRVMLGGVRDFIRLGWGAVFNSADICITIGVILYGWLLWRSELSLSPGSLGPNK